MIFQRKRKWIYAILTVNFSIALLNLLIYFNKILMSIIFLIYDHIFSWLSHGILVSTFPRPVADDTHLQVVGEEVEMGLLNTTFTNFVS